LNRLIIDSAECWTSMGKMERILSVVNIIFLLGILVSGMGKSREISDFNDYYRASKLYSSKADIYQYEQIKDLSGKYTLDDLFKNSDLISKLESLRGNVASYIYPPTFAYLLIPISHLSYENASLLFFLINYVCLLGSIYLMRSLFYPSRFTYILFFSLLFSFRFLENHANNNQVAFILLFLVLLSVKTKNNILSGFLLSLAVVIKLTPLIFVIHFIYKRRIKALFFFGAGLLFWILLPLIPDIDFGLKNWANWLDMVLLSALKNPVFRAWKNNQSLIATLAKYFMEGADPVNQLLFRMPFYSLSVGSVKLIFNFIVLLILVPLFHRYRKGIDSNQSLSALFILSVILSGISWIHTFAFFIFPIGFIFHRITQTPELVWRKRIYFILCALIILTGKSVGGSVVDSISLMFSFLLYIGLGLYFLILSLPRREH
jgi:hypothetical protein